MRLDANGAWLQAHRVDLVPGARIELDAGPGLEIAGPARRVAPGLVAAEVRSDGTLAVALVPDPEADDATRAEVNRLLGHARLLEEGRLGPVRVARVARASRELGGYRDAAVRMEPVGTRCALLGPEPTMLLSRVLGTHTRVAWPPSVVARVGAELARSMLDGSARRIDPFSVGLDERRVWRLDPALDALLRPELREGGSLQASVAWVGFLAPEQIRKRQSVASAPGDAIARHGLGVLLHELLTARALYGRETPLETLVAIRNGLPPALAPLVRDVPLDLAACVHALLDQDALRRPDPARILALLEPHASPDLAWSRPLFERHARPYDVLRVEVRRAPAP